MTPVISVENLSKVYRLGQIGSGTFANDLKLWWAKTRGKPNPLLRIGETDHGNRVGEDLWALKDVSFSVKQGEVLGIIGNNGAGKSTLLKILSRVTAPTSGRVKVKGRIASLLEVGTGFHPELTGRENTYLNGAILGMSRQEIDRKFDEIVDFSGVEKFIDTPVKRYSSGMKVRLGFSVAAHLDPEILIVDEVLAVGDAEFQKKCLGKLGDVAGEGRTVLFVSHNMGAIETLCKNVILLMGGEIRERGVSRTVISNYISGIVKNNTSTFDNCLRRGNGKLRLKEFHLETVEGIKQGQTISGSTVVFVFGYQNYTLKKNDKVSFGFSIKDKNGSRLAHYYSHFSNVYFTDLPEQGVVKCIIPDLLFAPGNYYVTCRVVINGDQNTGEEVDWPQISLPLKVIEGDFYNTGTFSLSRWGPILIKGEWNLVEVL